MNGENDKGSTPLYWAVRYGFPELCQILIKEGKAHVHQKRKLGLISPIVLASALGYTNIVKILLENGANVHTRITGGMTAIHHAAEQGNEDVISVLVAHQADVDGMDDAGNTPLMYAVKGDHMDAVEVLIGYGANMDCRNRMGQNVWDYAIENPSNELLVNLVNTYRSIKRAAERKLVFPVGKSPLHVAAMKGDCNKINCLLKLGTDPRCTDQNGNTYFHLAARENCVEVLETFADSVDPNQQNADGDTPLHLASQNGQMEAVGILLKKTKLEKLNNAGETALHVAAKSHASSHEVVSSLINVIVQANNWSLVDGADNKGNTALHVAAKAGRADIIGPLHHLNPKLLNQEGNTPLHAAAKTGQSDVLETLLEVFNVPGKGLDIDQQNAEGESLLHICAQQGAVDRVVMLIHQGADLSLRDTTGNSVLHALALKTVTDPNNRDNLLGVFDAIVNVSPRWWCMLRDLNCPDEYSELFNAYRAMAITHLTSNIINNDGYNVLCYATKVGAKEFLEKLLNLKDVNCTRKGHRYHYDVSYLIPETVPKRKKRKISANKNSVVDILKSNRASAPRNQMPPHSPDSCLNLVVELSDEILATQILDIMPIKQLVKNYWNTYQWIYGLLMVIHVVYMACFSAFSIPLLEDYITARNSINTEEDKARFPELLFLVWPGLLILFEIYNIGARLTQYCTKEDSTGSKDKKGGGLCKTVFRDPLHIPYHILNLLFGELSHVMSLIFSAFVITWFFLYQASNFNQAYVLAVALIVGWVFTVAFTKGFETVHAFSIMLKYIILRDITRFMFIYMFVLLAFSFGLHALFQIAPEATQEYDSAFDTIFLTFNLMIGMGEIFSQEFDEGYKTAGSSSTYVKVTYLAYVILSTIILLNLLIAMMSDTYNGIKSREGTTWRVGSVRLALQLERSVSFLPRFFQLIGVIRNNVRLDPEKERWMLVLRKHQVEEYKAVEVDEMLKAVHRLESKVQGLQVLNAELARKVDVLACQQETVMDDALPDMAAVVRRGMHTRPRTAGARRGWRRAKEAVAVAGSSKGTGDSQ